MRIATLLATLLLVSAASAQEPNSKHTAIKQAESAKMQYPVEARGIFQNDAPSLQPKPLPVLHPSLAEIARAARIARANSQRAALSIETDDLLQGNDRKNTDQRNNDQRNNDSQNKAQDR
jgi:hypothetical protein